jgi:hypothetical protein
LNPSEEDEPNLRLSEATKLKLRDLGFWETQSEDRGMEAIEAKSREERELARILSAFEFLVFCDWKSWFSLAVF